MVLITVIIVLAVILDQILKVVVMNTLEIGQSVPLIDGVFHFTYVQNYGAAFSILQNQQLFLIGITIATMLGLAFFLFHTFWKSSGWLKIAIALILGGGMGNLLDRVRMGYVVDYLDFRLIHFPVFNFADCCVVGGTILLAASILFFGDKNNLSGGR